MDITYAIALTMIPQLGCVSTRMLLSMYDDAEEIFHLSHKELEKVFGDHHTIIQAIEDATVLQRAKEEVEYCQSHNIQILYYKDAAYPQRFNREDCTDLPVILYYIGEANLNHTRVVSIVGTRKATDYGTALVERLVNGFKQEDIMVVSGLALGIDSAAHRAALSNMLPTVAVVAHGLEQIYPPQNKELARRIVHQGGGILTEYPHLTRILPGLFPARNRLIAALSDATVVGEASVKGGALITANLAMGYHRDILAFPGRVGDKYSEGCNRIIASQRAQLIENSDDFFAAMSWERLHKPVGYQTQIPVNLSAEETSVLSLLQQTNEVLYFDQIQEKLQLTPQKTSTILLSLELQNLIKALPGNKYRII